MSTLFIIETGGKPLREIYHPDICMTALFRLDQPMELGDDDVFELRAGQWFHITWEGDERHEAPVDGRWVKPDVPLVPEKPPRKTAKTVLVNVPKE